MAVSETALNILSDMKRNWMQVSWCGSDIFFSSYIFGKEYFSFYYDDIAKFRKTDREEA